MTRPLPQLFNGWSKIRSQQLSLAMACMLSSGHLFALGLGELKHSSSLGQPLEARIELISPKDYGETDIKVRQLGVDDAAKMGIELLSYFNRFKLAPTLKDGQLYIRLYSTDAVTEPFINVLVELKWPSGSVYREYTLLLDLPVIASAPASSKNSQTVAATNKAANTKPAKTRAKPQPLSGQHYRVRSGDSLSKIAQRITRNTSHKRSDVMQWLLVNNPQAFINGDPNRLKAAVRINLPQQANLATLTTATAPRVASSTDQKAPVSSIPQPQAKPERQPVIQNSGVEKQTADARLSLKTSDIENGSITDLNRLKEEQLKERIRRTQEKNDQLQRETKAIEARINRLEGSSYIKSLERLVQLREQEIEELNARLATKPKAQPSTSMSSSSATATVVGDIDRFSGSRGVTIDSQLAAVASAQAKPQLTNDEPTKDEPATEAVNSFDSRIIVWIALLIGAIGSAYFYWHQKKAPKPFVEDDESRDDDAELARLEAALEAQDQSIGYDATAEDINFSSLFDESGQPTGAAHVGKFKPDKELSQKIQNKTENYVPDTPTGLHVIHHHEHDNLDDLISDALAYCSQGYYDRAESMLLAEQSRSGAESRITTALNYIANLKKNV